MSRLLTEPSQLSKAEFLPADSGSWSAVDVTGKIQGSSRSYRRDHCAIFADPDSIGSLLQETGLEVSLLDPEANWHWTGARAHRKLKRVIAGEYEEWFHWFMKWQRFNAFQIVVLINPVRRMVDDDRRGYLDGLLTRLLDKSSVHRVVVVEEEHFQPIIKEWLGGGRSEETAELKGKFRQRQFGEAVASLLYGTHLSSRRLSSAVAATLFSKMNPGWESMLQDVKRRPALVERMSRSVFTAGYHGREMVESLETQEARESLENPEEPLPPLFKRARDRGPSELSQDWLEGLTRSLLDSQGWFTVPGLYDHVLAETQRVIQTSESRPDIFNDNYDSERPGEMHVFAPSAAVLRRIAERLAKEEGLLKATWVREVGRPSTVYHLPGRLPFDQEKRCGQCTFYVPLRRQCRIWWLLNQSYGHRHDRWSRDGARPLSAFEVHKMRNSWRVGPHSSACLNFLDKKRDYARNSLPKLCDVCSEELPTTPKGPMVVCGNCRTRYFTLRRGKVRVLTSYEHEFNRRYRELAGADPSSDLKRLIEERQGSAQSIVEQAIYDEHRRSLSEDPDSAPKTVMLFPGDKMLVREGRLYVLKRRSIESLPLAGSTLVDHGRVVSEEQRGALESVGMTVRSVKPAGLDGDEGPRPRRYDIAPAVETVVASYPEFLRKMTLAMAQSAIHATERIGRLVEIPDDDVQTFLKRQRLSMRQLERAPPARFLVCEAAIMKEYWSCYYLPLKGALQRSGPRKKARFVREFVADPTGRARGYTAVDAAINYLHQRRLFKARSANVQLGLDFFPGEGFLHRKRWNPEGIGLVLDLIDPFKFADREKLLGAVLAVDLNWREFYSATDRHGARFYYPKPDAVGMLEGIGEAADRMIVGYEGWELPLLEAYEKEVDALIKALKAGESTSFTPFVFDSRSPRRYQTRNEI